MLRGVWQGTLKYILSMCFIPAAPQPALISVWEALILLQEFRKFRQRTPSYTEESWGIILSSCKRAFGDYLAQRCQEIKQKTAVQTSKAWPTAKPAWPNVSPYPTVNNSSYAGTQKKISFPCKSRASSDAEQEPLSNHFPRNSCRQPPS